MTNKNKIIVLLLLTLVGVIGGTFAYYTSTSKLTNEFITGTYSTSVIEEFTSPNDWTPGTTTTKRVNVKNNGSVSIAARASYVEKWTAQDGTDLPLVRDGENVAQFAIGSKWKKGEDEWYYYQDILKSGEISTDFISAVTFNPNFELKEGIDINCETIGTIGQGSVEIKCSNLSSGYGGSTYTLDITIETIQADKKWNYVVGNSLDSYVMGDVVVIAGEVFNVIDETDNTVVLLAQKNLGSNYRQTSNQSFIILGEATWSAYEDVDIHVIDNDVSKYIDNYVAYLQGETGDSTLSGTLITLGQLDALGCDLVNSTCVNSDYAGWLINGQYFWTRTAYDSTNIWVMMQDGSLDTVLGNSNFGGVRPVITMSKEILLSL